MADEQQVQMYWPLRSDKDTPGLRVPYGYTLRTFQQGDKAQFFKLMDRVGWSGWDNNELEPWAKRLLPNGWFTVVHDETEELVASAMALHSAAIEGGGELGWVAGNPEHAGIGLGRLITTAVIRRFLNESCHPIHLYTETFRLAAIKIYLSLGWEPVIVNADAIDHWGEVCSELNWPFSPEAWKNWQEINE